MKYHKGTQITSFGQLMEWTKWSPGQQPPWVYLRDKPLHFSMILHMSVGTVKTLMASGQIWEAIQNGNPN